MSDNQEKINIFDPTGMMKSMRDAGIDRWSKMMTEIVSSDAYAEANAEMLNTWLTNSAPFRTRTAAAFHVATLAIDDPSLQLGPAFFGGAIGAGDPGGGAGVDAAVERLVPLPHLRPLVATVSAHDLRDQLLGEIVLLEGIANERQYFRVDHFVRKRFQFFKTRSILFKKQTSHAQLFAQSLADLASPEERYPYLRILISIVEQAHPEWTQAPSKDRQIAHLIGLLSNGKLNDDEVADIVRVRDEERGFFYD